MRRILFTLAMAVAASLASHAAAAAADSVAPAAGGGAEPAAGIALAGEAVAPADTIPGHKIFPLPFAFYQPETRFGGGFGVLHTYRTAPGTRTSSNGLLAIYTERKQFSVLFGPDLYTAGNGWRVSGEILWSRFPDTFFGIGNNTDSDDDESFTLEHARVALDVRRKVVGGLYAGVLALRQRTEMRESEDGGRLSGGDITGRDGGTLGGAGALLVLDDRDNVFAPNRGRLVTLSFRRYGGSFGSDFASNRTEIDARQYTELAPGHVLAVHALAGVSDGRRPFYDLATLGGASVLRGIYEGRYRERNRTFAQAEYRFPLWHRFGGTVFAGAGQVARDADRFAADALHAAGGVGLRYLLMKREGARLRIDFGWADDGMQLYMGFGEAF